MEAFEVYHQRKAFLFTNRFTAGYGGGRNEHESTRLVVGSRFQWMSEAVTVTSFNDADGYVVACSYSCTESKDCKSAAISSNGHAEACIAIRSRTLT